MGLLGSLFGGSSSSSSSSTSTTSNVYDQRTAAEGEALALGQGAQFTINQPVSQEVVQLFTALTDVTKNVLSYAGDTVNTTAQNAQDIYAAARQQIEDAGLSGGARDIKSLLPYIGLVAGAGILVLFLLRK